MAKTVVTGGRGFIGSHVVDALVDAGHQVTVIDHCGRPHREDIGFAEVDLLDLSSVLNASKGAEYIFHLAAVSNVNHAYKYPVHNIAVNVLGTTHVLEAARIHGTCRVYLASTVWVYNGASNERSLDESAPFYLSGAGHIYTSSKMACEMICHNYGQLYNVPFTILRLGIAYGPRMREELLIPILIKKALAGQPLTIAGNGSQYRNFVYAGDLAQAHLLAMQEVAVNQTYNLEGSRKVTVLEVAEGIRQIVGDQVKIEFVPDRPGDFSGKAVAAEKARRELGWKPTTEFEDGLQKTVAWFRQRWSK